MSKRLFGKSLVNWYQNLIRKSKYRWLILLGTMLYLVSPLDISPDVFPVIGWIDDGLIATIAITEITQLLLDRKRNLSQKTDVNADEFSTTTVNEAVIDVDAVSIS